jgi:hypothetical protein
MRRLKLLLAAAALVMAAAPAVSAKLPATWDGLVEVKGQKLEAVYLLPDADFRGYSKVMIDPAQVAFQQDWRQNYNSQTISLANQITAQQVQQDIAEAEAGLNKIFAEAFTKEGYQIVTAPGPGVARVGVGVADLSITAPPSESGFGANYGVDAGEATLIVEVRDSVTNQLLGRGLDRRAAGADEGDGFPRNAVTNRDDFKALFQTWAGIAAKGLTELRAMSPINTEGVRKQ